VLLGERDTTRAVLERVWEMGAEECGAWGERIEEIEKGEEGSSPDYSWVRLTWPQVEVCGWVWQGHVVVGQTGPAPRLAPPFRLSS
jgi:hypothetical protein